MKAAHRTSASDLDLAIEMDTLAHVSSTHQSSGSHGKSPALEAATTPSNKRDYAVGVVLLLIVVFLWTASNFVTQVRFIGSFCRVLVDTGSV